MTGPRLDAERVENGVLTDAELDEVTGGDGKTTTTATTKGIKPTEYIVVTQQDTLISST
jgi:hypothetical protein